MIMKNRHIDYVIEKVLLSHSYLYISYLLNVLSKTFSILIVDFIFLL